MNLDNHLNIIFDEVRVNSNLKLIDIWKNINIQTKSRLDLNSSIAFKRLIRSFFLWDDLVSRTHCKKVMPTNDISVLIDTLQEFGFNLLVYLLNIFIVFAADHPSDMIMDALAMEFIMDLDNQFKELYFKNIPNAAVDIYDNIFVSKSDNRVILKQKINEDKFFCCIKNMLMVPYKILIISLILFPVFCACIIFYGPICK